MVEDSVRSFVAYSMPHLLGRAEDIMKTEYPSLIHERVSFARDGKNPTVIARLKSGWVVLGDDQRLKGYTLLLADPIADNLNEVDEERRRLFLWEMSVVGDALTEVLNPFIMREKQSLNCLKESIRRGSPP